MTTIEMPQLCLVVLVGVTGSGKSTFARAHFRGTEVLSSDTFRAMVSDDPTDQAATVDAFDALYDVAGRRLRRGLLTVVDATSLRPEDRRGLLDLAKEHDVFAVAVVLDVPLAELRHRSQDRAGIDAGVVVRQHKLLKQHARNLRKEGFRFVHVLDGVETIDATRITRTALFSDVGDVRGPFDLIGDIHGCRAELDTLLDRLGWVGNAHPDGRKLIFVGDLVDRGPDTPGVLRRVMDLVAAGNAWCVRGNHEEKLIKVLQRSGGARRPGRARGTDSVSPDSPALTHGLAESVAQLRAQSPEFVDEVIAFLDSLVSHYVFDDGKLVVAHAGLAQRYHNRSSGRVRSLAMYGETTGEKDRWGYPVRGNWARDYRGPARVVYGHTPVTDVGWVNNTLCIDTGCVFGGRLTALRYPELAVVDVPATAVHWPGGRPMGYGETDIDLLMRAELHLDDVAGKRIVHTRFGPALTVREEVSASALEIVSRFAIDPRWVRYLPPTMSPVGALDENLLEDPAGAFRYYADLGVAEVICERKHMGSRAVLVLTRGDAARRVFGVTDGTCGALYTRTGRPFFDAATTAGIISRALDAAHGVLDLLGSDWLILDAELLPWNIKGEQLIREQFAEVAAAGQSQADVLAAELAQATARGLDVGALSDRCERDRRDRAAFTAAYAQYVDAGASIDDVRIAPFEVLAAGNADGAQTFADRPHTWHLDIAEALAAAGPDVFTPTQWLPVSTGDASSCAAGARWWADLTAAGGEGMVVKPSANLTRDDKNHLVPPGVKVRGREYLRIIYGQSYLDDLGRLRKRELKHKRSMAMREYQLGREALSRHVDGAPLWQVHECVFAVLALESEPVDSRL